MKREVNNKVVVITGASSGIGKALALEALKRNNCISICARNTVRLENTVNEFRKLGFNNIFYNAADVSNKEQSFNFIRETLNHYGKIDILINNAGISMRAAFKDLDLKVIEQIMGINFWGTVYCTKFALPSIIENKGSIVFVSSIAGYVPLPGRTGYCASKSAIHGFLNTLRIELKKYGVHIMIAAPGFTESNIRYNALMADGSLQGTTPRDESIMMKPEAVAKIIFNAIKNNKRSVIMTSQGKLTTFLYKFFPSFVDKLIYNHMKKEGGSFF